MMPRHALGVGMARERGRPRSEALFSMGFDTVGNAAIELRVQTIRKTLHMLAVSRTLQHSPRSRTYSAPLCHIMKQRSIESFNTW